ncbi:indolepyruvate ferredoxin oxidoreductase [Dysgonomonas sp. GY75]|uniref:thiamine pyrophosphate-dependent enzyme n=1 Tax=Dysgonomonas sp. GY75 TaxID=2780419 RepID=UPI0018843273|nr:thiamine pyrophosphate-dependent enzyme [Dysgonomonas sp. GY75]MBF0647718.1 indolepyruvate ferredoxin oxidoreductase [Dysgonomonas sp. GY75]
MREKLLMLGDQAIALGAIHAGITGVYAYPGTPSTEITEYIQDSPLAKERNIHSQWCTNEKTAVETALGVSYIGKRALVCMKHVGLNVAADAFINSAMTGTNGGLVVLVADDPSMHSSQNEQDSRFYGKFAFTPIFEPSSQQEAYDMVRYAFDISEKYELPVLMRLTTRMAHSRAVVEISEIREQNEINFPEDKSRWVLLPVNARRRYNELLAAQPELEKISTESPYNLYKKGSRQGIIACGIGYNYLMESFPDGCDRTVLKISQYPLPKELIREVLNECDEVLILEDGQPFVEEQLRGLLDETGKVKGRLTGELPRVGELTPDNVRSALGFAAKVYQGASENVVPRPPALCTGCGHRDVYDALNEVLREYENAKVFSDIGCYTLGALPPFRAIDTCVDMGASITMAKGAADGGLFPSIAVIGDSTFTHSGITGLLDAVNSNASVTIVISDNLTTAMTGGQDSAGYEKLEDICFGVGVEKEHLRIVIPLPKNIEEIKNIIREEIEYNGVSVIIPRRECIQTLKKHTKKK